MGLNAYVPETDIDHRLGSYGWYHSFRLTVCNHLEGGEWGSKYPLLMNHSDCDGEYSPTESEKLLYELNDIRERFKDIRYPANICKDKRGKVLDVQPAYGEEGTFCFSGGFGYGAHEKGIVVQVSIYPRWGERACELQEFVEQYSDFFVPFTGSLRLSDDKSYVAYFDRLELIGETEKGFWRGVNTSGVVDFPEALSPCCPAGTVLIERGTASASEVFGTIIDRLTKLAEASISAKQPIYFY